MANEIEHLKYGLAADFFEAIQPTNEMWLDNVDSWGSKWIFRGQTNADWSLTPTAWRWDKHLETIRNRLLRECVELVKAHAPQMKSRAMQYDLVYSERNVAEALAQGRAEMRILAEFSETADDLGIKVPGRVISKDYDWSPELRDFPNLRFPVFGSAFALAKHYGLPASALDWTRKAKIAVLFAACDVNAERTETGDLALWALNTGYLHKYNTSSPQHYSREDFGRYFLKTFSKGENPYLHAQDGLFVVPVMASAHYALFGEWPTLEDYACRVTLKIGKPALRKLTLPWSEAGEVLRLLAIDGVSEAHLKPTLDSIVRSLYTKWSWSEG